VLELHHISNREQVNELRPADNVNHKSLQLKVVKALRKRKNKDKDSRQISIVKSHSSPRNENKFNPSWLTYVTIHG
jgi:5-methylcytosine-specific restriction endonuclease McrA